MTYFRSWNRSLMVHALERREVPATFTVDSTLDTAAAGTLRWAVGQANSAAGADTIAFAIPGSGIQTISLTSALPAVTGTVRIDGRTQPTYSGTPLIVVRGQSAGAAAIGFELKNHSGSEIYGLTIQKFSSTGGAGVATTGSGGGHTIAGCFIGTDSTGQFPASNYLGVRLGAPAGCTIGGKTAADRNVISGNTVAGIQINDGSSAPNGTTIFGNFIGTDATGAVALGNGTGVLVSDNFGGTTEITYIGGVNVGEGNTIAGNIQAGIDISASLSGNDLVIVRGNRIGIAADGATPLGNNTGIRAVSGTSNVQIGEDTPGALNVISGNNVGIELGTALNLVSGNYIGVAADGKTAVGNQIGLHVTASACFIGGATPGERNVISGNTTAGVVLDNFSPGVWRVQGNYIGVDASNSMAVPNQIGIMVEQSSLSSNGRDIVIGGDLPSQANVIANNVARGVIIKLQGRGVRLARNTYANNGLAIDLSTTNVDTGDGVTANPSGTTGGNQLQRFPILTSATNTGTQTNFVGTLTAVATSQAHRIEFYASQAANSTGYGEGERFLSFQDVTTNASGIANFNVTLNTGVIAPGWVITATATNLASNETSEFSQAVALTGGGPVGGVLTGVVFNDTNNNKVQDGSETGVAGVVAFVDANDNNTLDAGELAAPTDANGVYNLPEANNGSYGVRIVVPPTYTQTTDNPAPTNVSGGATVSGGTFGIRPTGIVGPIVVVQSITVNDAVVQRSAVTNIKLAFNQAVVLPANPADAFQLTRVGDNAVVNLAASVLGDTVTLTFVGGAVDATSLADGRYKITVLAAQVSGGQFDGNNDGTPGDNYVLIGDPAAAPKLFRLFGDVDGDGDVDTSDFGAFRGVFGGVSAIFDFDFDGDVDTSDFGAFRGRFGASV